jgi:hypothetical protein
VGCEATSILVASITLSIVVESYKLLTSNWLMSPQSARWAVDFEYLFQTLDTNVDSLKQIV